MTHSSSINLFAFLSACLLYAIIGPYFLWGLIEFPYFIPFLSGLLAIIFLKFSEIKRYFAYYIFILFLLIIYSLKANVSIGGFVVMSFSLILPFAKTSFSQRVFNIFVNIYTILISVSSIVWIFVLLGVVPSIGTIEPTLKDHGYIIYPFVVKTNTLEFFRFNGLFDEPGVVGTFNAIFLYILGFKKSDWRIYPLLLSGLLSLSLFFFLCVALYFIVANFEKINFKSFALFAILLGVFYVTTKDNELISSTIWERLEWDSDSGSISGDNRLNEDADAIYERKKGTLDYWFGDSELQQHEEAFKGSSSYKVVVLRSGMVFFLLYLLFFILLARKYSGRRIPLLFLVLLIIVEYQRPWLFGTGYFFLFPYFARSLGEQKRINNFNT